MITIEQCRAARGLLGWTQQDLADASGLSKTAINNFEKGHSDIKNESLRAVRMAFESADIEFTGTDGLRKRKENIRTLKGETAFSDLLDDIYETLKDQGGEVLISNVSENSIRQISSKKLQQHLDRLKEHNISERILCSDGAKSPLGSENFCRWVSGDSFAISMAYFIYGQKIAMELWDQSMIIITHSREAANSERQRFERLWSMAIPLAEKSKKAADRG